MPRFEDRECGFQKVAPPTKWGKNTEYRKSRLIADQTAIMKTDVLFAAIDGHATAEALPRDLLLLLTDLAVECVGVLQRGEAVGLVRGVGPAASAWVTASSARRGGAPAVLAAVGKLALKAEDKMTLVCVRRRPQSPRE